LKISFKKLATFRQLPVRDKLFILRAVIIALFIRLFLKVSSFKKLTDLLQVEQMPSTSNDEQAVLKRHSNMIQMVYNFYPLINCLAISVTFWYLLRRRGIKTELKFGTMKESGKLKAHAWLEHGGLPLAPDSKIGLYKTFGSSIL
jgi:hypothetical protein